MLKDVKKKEMGIFQSSDLLFAFVLFCPFFNKGISTSLNKISDLI